MKDFVTPHIRRYQEYIPGEQSQSKIIKLNANENHLPPHPKVKEYLRKFSVNALKYYPDPHCQKLERVVRKSYRLKKNVGLVFGNGADEILRGIFKTFFTPNKDSVLLTELTYPGYKTYAELNGIKIEYLPVNPDFTISFKGLEKSRSRVFFITNPNNPTGSVLKASTIIDKIKEHRDKLFVIDEAYGSFSQESCLKFLPQHNLIVVKTLSKSFSACGLRLGFGVTTHDHARCIRKTLDPYNLSILTIEVGSVILSDLDYMKDNINKIIQIREWFRLELINIGFHVYPSDANFLLISPPDKAKADKPTAKLLFEYLRKHKIFVRYFNKPLLADHLRITIGSKKDLLQVLTTIKKFYKK